MIADFKASVAERTRLPALKLQELERLNAAMLGNLMLGNFESETINLLSTNGNINNSNRNWWWHFQQLPTLRWAFGNWLSFEHNLQLEDVLTFNKKMLVNWLSLADSVPLKWHDHATAIRMQNLADWLKLLCCFGGNSSEELEHIELVKKLIEHHLKLLMQEDFYSKHNNHGFEQARISLLVATEIPELILANEATLLAITRIEDEIRFAFTEEGVHKENSPGYHWFMLKQLLSLRTFLSENNYSLDSIDFDKLISKAERFLNHIALSDGSLPLIGDTERKPAYQSFVKKLRSSKHKKEFGVFDYSESGYFISNYKWKGKNIHFVLKCGFLANYHRHDDDMAIHFAVGNEIVFGDAGLFSHDKNDIYRAYVRSPYAHNTFFPRGVKAKRDCQSLKIKPAITVSSESTVVAKTAVYRGFLLQRRVKRLNSDFSKFKITDKVIKRSDEQQLITNFIIPNHYIHLDINESDGLVVIVYNDFLVSLVYPKPAVNLRVLNGDASSEHLDEISIISGSMSRKEAATRLEFLWSDDKQDKREFIIYLSGKD